MSKSKRVYQNDGSRGKYGTIGGMKNAGKGFRSPTFQTRAGGIPARIGGGTIKSPGRKMVRGK